MRQLTTLSEGHALAARTAARMVAGKERPVVRMERRPAVAELELAVGGGEVREAGRPVLQAARAQVHREAAHLAGAAEERAAAHRRQLLQSSLLGPLVLEPDLRTRERDEGGELI